MVDHTSSQEELNAYWLEKNATSKWDQGHTHYVDPDPDENRMPSDCPVCRENALAEIEVSIEFWDAPFWSEEEIRKAFCWWLNPSMLEKAIDKLKAGDE